MSPKFFHPTETCIKPVDELQWHGESFTKPSFACCINSATLLGKERESHLIGWNEVKGLGKICL